MLTGKDNIPLGKWNGLGVLALPVKRLNLFIEGV
jgi:hypothetical protein